MAFTPGGCRDLRKYQEDPKVADAFSKLVSGGKYGYKTVIEKKVEEKRCKNCNARLEGNEKFCPECGAKTEWQQQAEKPVILLTAEELEQKFKSGQESEAEILAYMRDMLKIPEITAFELISKWRKEMQAQKQTQEIDLNQFKG
jgi:RNA polymerase subunit RPABC4/transcription elongation factor Spt4